ncbi:hypothetical protein [Aminobacter aminovorans]|uniref:hypothetical protein n=1 Tax=Aminobacter aminovorans TaxID=83263 RepID=UPI00285AE902|nr:hypothetical protein [Aminobacter aminovorans]MDR7223329.1 hypothetical protein [Aminobacter aminovorans]
MSDTDLHNARISWPGRRSGSELPLETSDLGAQAAVTLRPLRRGLGLAAAPIFAAMAVISAVTPTYDLCASAAGGLSVTGMTWMYCLMCLFHIDAWFRLLDRGRHKPDEA